MLSGIITLLACAIVFTDVQTVLKELLSVGAALFVFAVFGSIYFLPTYVGRHKRNATAIFVLNLFAGWTFIGWVVALVWATTQD